MKIFRSIKKVVCKKYFLPLAIFTFTLTVYVRNLSPDVFGGDSGDFLSAIAVRGVAHPSGYPLITILGILFSYLPINATLAWKVGLISTIFSALTILFVYLTCHELTKNRAIAAISSFTLAFTKPFWLYAEVVEVFALNSFFISILTFLTIKYGKAGKENYLYTLAFFTGLSLTNNLVVILIFPPVLLFTLLTQHKNLFKPPTIFRCLLFFVLGLTPYLYIPVAASFNPSVNWGNVTSWDRFVHLALRKDYGWGRGLDTNFENYVTRSLVVYGQYFRAYASYLFLALGVLGVLKLLLIKKYSHFTFFFLAFLFLGPLFFIYAKLEVASLHKVATVERFFIQGLIIFTYLFSFGVSLVNGTVTGVIKDKGWSKILSVLILLMFSFVPISLFIKNNWKTNLSNSHIGDNLGKDILNTLPRNSVFFVSSDNYIFNPLYAQKALNYRSDVVIPGRNTGYYQALLRADMYNPNNPDDEMKRLVSKNALNDKYFFQMLVKLTDKGLAYTEKRVEITFDDHKDKIISIPHGLVFRLAYKSDDLTSKEEYLQEQEEIWENYQIDDLNKNINLISENVILATILREYDFAYKHLANYLFEQYSDPGSAAEYVKMAHELNPVFSSSNKPVAKNIEVENMNIKMFGKN